MLRMGRASCATLIFNHRFSSPSPNRIKSITSSESDNAVYWTILSGISCQFQIDCASAKSNQAMESRRHIAETDREWKESISISCCHCICFICPLRGRLPTAMSFCHTYSRGKKNQHQQKYHFLHMPLRTHRTGPSINNEMIDALTTRNIKPNTRTKWRTFQIRNRWP